MLDYWISKRLRISIGKCCFSRKKLVYWLYRIAEEELKGENRANYGTEILKKLSKELKKEYGKGFELRNLYYFL